MDTPILEIIGKRNGEKSLPVITHLNDCTFVGEYLWDNWMCQSLKDSLCSLPKAREKFIFLCLSHDIGKFSSDFQALIKENKVNGLRHDVLSGYYLSRYLELDDGVENSMVEIIRYHHSRLHDRVGMEKEDDHIEKTLCDSITTTTLFSLLDSFLERLCLKKEDLLSVWETKHLLAMSGLLICSDWIASNDRLFPLDDSCDRYNTDKLAYLNLPRLSVIEDGSESFFHRVFGFTPSPLQDLAFTLPNNNSCSNSVFIIEAPTGCGKTEAALALAYSIIHRIGASGIYMALPTCATSNALYDRYSSFVHNVFGDSYSVILEHSKAKLFIDTPQSDLLLSRKLEGLNHFIIGTTDHVIKIPKCLKYFTMLYPFIANKVVIFDEVHSYDTTMFVNFLKTLSILRRYNVPVIILSATLPNQYKKQILSIYTRVPEGLPLNTYPSITYTSGNRIEVAKVELPESSSADIQFMQGINGEDDTQGIIGEIERLGCSGYYGIIVNTVERSQSIYRSLSSHFGSDYTILLHSRIESTHRTEIESKVLSTLGKHPDKYNRYSKNLFVVVVGTQILEQSIDIDFDYLFTDLCPADCLIQRIGRLHRHKNNNPYRPSKLQAPVCSILQAYKSDSVRECMDKFSSLIYSEYRLAKTYAELLNGCIKDTPSFIQRSYDDSLDVSLFDMSLEKSKETYLSQFKKDQESAKSQMLDRFCYNGFSDVHLFYSKYDINSTGIYNCVRQVLNTLEVVILNYDEESGTLRYVHTNAKASLFYKDVLRHTVILPYKLVRGEYINQVIDELEKGALKIEGVLGYSLPKIFTPYLILTNNQFTLKRINNKGKEENFTLSYDSELGLVIE